MNTPEGENPDVNIDVSEGLNENTGRKSSSSFFKVPKDIREGFNDGVQKLKDNMGPMPELSEEIQKRINDVHNGEGSNPKV